MRNVEKYAVEIVLLLLLRLPDTPPISANFSPSRVSAGWFAELQVD